jgi:hypothetical protein
MINPISKAIPISAVLQRIHDQAPQDHFTLGWLIASLSSHSFGILILLLSLVAIAPGASVVAGVLLLIPACEMIVGRTSPNFPRWVAACSLPTQHLAALVQRALPMLRYLEKVIHPRWPTPHSATKRLVGAVIAILSASLVFIPIPLTLQLPTCFEMRPLSGGLMSSAPE